MGGAAALRAVIFDLWNTLADWPVEAWDRASRRIAERVGLPLERVVELWAETYDARQTGPLRDSLRPFSSREDVVEEVVEIRRGVTEHGLVPREGAVETIRTLRERGFRIGLITVCSDEVPHRWPETQFHGLFDAEVFSCSVGLRKPDPRIYLLACSRLEVSPEQTVYVGDGRDDELAGAERVGMRAILLERPDEEQAWEGERITNLTELLSIV